MTLPAEGHLGAQRRPGVGAEPGDGRHRRQEGRAAGALRQRRQRGAGRHQPDVHRAALRRRAGTGSSRRGSRWCRTPRRRCCGSPGVRNNGTTTGFRTNYSLVNLRATRRPRGLRFTLFDATGTSLATQTVTWRRSSTARTRSSTCSRRRRGDEPGPPRRQGRGADRRRRAGVHLGGGQPHRRPGADPRGAAAGVADLPPGGGAHPRRGRDRVAQRPADHEPGRRAAHLGDHATRPAGTTRCRSRRSGHDRGGAELPDGRPAVLGVRQQAHRLPTRPAASCGSRPPTATRSTRSSRRARSTRPPTGTFGQNITPITPEMGVAAGQNRRLLLTGMSSEDIARTNLGFVNLSDTSGVNFAVTFYDESGNVLNPQGRPRQPIPYTFSLGVGGWDQDKLENRFKNAGWPALGANLRAISAVIEVTDGGPGTAYATVIDSQTGDPNFILAQRDAVSSQRSRSTRGPPSPAGRLFIRVVTAAVSVPVRRNAGAPARAHPRVCVSLVAWRVRPRRRRRTPRPSVEIHGLAKRYLLFGRRRDRALALLGRTGGLRFVTALEGIDLEVRPGEAVGVVGENGSGKSTLLRLVAGISTPDAGTIRVAQPVAPILELGLGFHPEFTGRENALLYGSLLGIPEDGDDGAPRRRAGVRGARRVRGPAVADVLLGDGGAPGVRGRHQRGPAGAGGGRGARGGRRRVPEEVRRPHGAVQGGRAHRPVLLARDVPRHQLLRAGGVAAPRADPERGPVAGGGGGVRELPDAAGEAPAFGRSRDAGGAGDAGEGGAARKDRGRARARARRLSSREDEPGRGTRGGARGRERGSGRRRSTSRSRSTPRTAAASSRPRPTSTGSHR